VGFYSAVAKSLSIEKEQSLCMITGIIRTVIS